MVEAVQQFLDNQNTSGKVRITIDNREDKSFDDLIKAHGAVVERKQLEIGDFICSDRCIVERKTRNDFEASIIDGRLFQQLPNLVSNYERVVIIVEGESNAERISKEALLGTYATLVTDFGLGIFFTRNMEKTAELVYAIAKHEQIAEKRPLRVFAKRKTYTIAQTQRSIIEMFPMVGPKHAKALLEHFGNIQNIVNASEQELREVEGMGEKRAKAVKRIIDSHYDSGEDAFTTI